MSDAGGPGSHVLYQDFTVPLGTTAGVVSFDLFINNGAELFATPNPNNLSFAATNRAGGLNLNQQVRVDILTAASDPFSVAASDVLLNLYQSNPGDPLISGYNTYVFDVSALFLARQGQVLRLRFAEVDNLSFLNVGVDNVRVDAVPEPASLLSLVVGGLCAAGIAVWRRRYALSSASGWG
jgi:hypothetical protein